MTAWLQCAVVTLLFFCVSALSSGMETGGYLVNRLRLRHLARQGAPRARRLHLVLSDAHRFIFTVLIANNIANYLLTRHVTQLYLKNMESENGLFSGSVVWNAETAETLTLLAPLFLFGELLPKNWFRRHADRLMYALSGMLLFFQRIFWPLTSLLKLIFEWVTGGRGRTEALSGFSLSLQGLHDYFAEDSQKDLLSDHQRSMIRNLVSMHRFPVQQVLHPLAASAAVSEKASVQEGIDRMRECDLDQIIVYRGSIRHVIGWVSLFDLIDPSLKPSDPIKPLLRKMIRISATLSLDRAFHRLRATPEAPALVVIRSSRAVGLLHLRDVARHIVNHS